MMIADDGGDGDCYRVCHVCANGCSMWLKLFVSLNMFAPYSHCLDSLR